MHHVVKTGDCLELMRAMPDNSVDSMVTDPPAGIAFMSKKWDRDKGGRRQWIAWLAEVMTEALRVLKPGAHALVWALPRTSHWTGTALEDAGFDVRDCLYHVFGSGFVKNHNISKAIDKMHGAEREVVGVGHSGPNAGMQSLGDSGIKGGVFDITAPSTPDAIRWNGFGTAVSPSQEVWWLVRKPLDGTIAANVLRHGTGAICIDGCRVKTSDVVRTTGRGPDHASGHTIGSAWSGDVDTSPRDGRWPPNILLTHAIDCNTTGRCVPWCPVGEMDRQSGQSGQLPVGSRRGGYSGLQRNKAPVVPKDDATGGASRFFPRFRYQAKPSTAEKDAGLDSLPMTQVGFPMRSADDDSDGIGGDGSKTHRDTKRRNTHATVKGIPLMRWLVRLVTPPGGIVLDPFVGSGTTGCACVEEGVSFIGCEMNEEYATIARHRIAHYAKQVRLF